MVFFGNIPSSSYIVFRWLCFSHHNIFKDAGVKQFTYRYYKPSTRGLDFDGLKEDLKVTLSCCAACFVRVLNCYEHSSFELRSMFL